MPVWFQEQNFAEGSQLQVQNTAGLWSAFVSLNTLWAADTGGSLGTIEEWKACVCAVCVAPLFLPSTIHCQHNHFATHPERLTRYSPACVIS